MRAQRMVADPVEHLQAVHARQADVEHEDVGAELREELERFLGGGGGDGMETGLLEESGERLAGIVVVVHEEHDGTSRRFGHGRYRYRGGWLPNPASGYSFSATGTTVKAVGARFFL